MKGLSVLLILAVLTFAFSGTAFTASSEPVTPYGDFCPGCSKYGFCKIRLSISQATKALKEYYAEKGLTVRIEQIKGRFIIATILEKNKVVDRIIFDRRSGRIRSIY